MSSKRATGEGTVRFNDERRRWEGRIVVDTKPNPQPRPEFGSRKAKAWRAEVPIRRMFTGRTRRIVLDQMNDALRVQRQATSQTMSPDQKIDDFLDWWLENVLEGTVSAKTQQTYTEIVQLYINKHLPRGRTLATLTPSDVTRMLRSMERSGLSVGTQRYARTVLRRALRRAEQEGVVLRNAASIADGPKGNPKEGRTMTPGEAKQFLAHLPTSPSGRIQRLEAAWVIMLSLGLRMGECLALRWSDLELDPDAPRVSVNGSLSRLNGVGLVIDQPKTMKSRRVVHIPKAAAIKLGEHQARQRLEREAAGGAYVDQPLGHDLVFRTAIGGAVDPRNFRTATYRATEDAGIGRWSPHELRHTAASLLIAQGVPLEVVSNTLGHASIRVTADVYMLQATSTIAPPFETNDTRSTGSGALDQSALGGSFVTPEVSTLRRLDVER